MTDDPPQPAGASLLRRLGLLLALTAACARAVSSYDPLPGWGLDPLNTVGPHNGLGPADSATLSALSLLGLAMVLAAAWRTREHVPRALLVLAGLGLVPVAYHGWLGPTASVENAATGLAWAGAIAGGLAACLACRRPTERALVVACCAGLAGPLAVRAAIQVYVEHPVLVEEFRANREAFLASHGWTPGSAMARSFERRLTSPDASAWFAMSNVYASAMAGCVAVFAAAAVHAVRERLWQSDSRADLYRAAGLVAGLACSAGGLLIALPAGGDLPKGAAAATALGIVLVAVGYLAHRLPPLARALLRPGLLGPLLIMLALLAVLARGLIGERLGELSILFRFFYAQAALRTLAEHLLWGVGPDGFQAAYLLDKNPISPEEVASPHSVLLDYVSMLGVMGAAWCVLLVIFAARAGRRLIEDGAGPKATPAPSDPAGSQGRPMLWVATAILASGAVSFLRESLPLAAAAPEAFGLLLFDGVVKQLGWGLLWLGLAAALLPRPGGSRSPAIVVGVAAAALAILAHAQIELTLTDVSSSAWALLLLGAASACWPARSGSAGNPPSSRSRRAGAAVGAAVSGIAAIAVLGAALPIWSWQAELRSTARLAAEPTTFVLRAQALAAGAATDSPQELFADLSGATGRPVPPTAEGFNAALGRFRIERAAEAADRLEALAKRPSTPSRATADAAADLWLTLVALTAGLGHDPAPTARRSLDLASWAAARWPDDSRSWRNLSRARRQAAELAPGLADAGSDIDPLLRAAALDPYSPMLAAELARRLSATGEAAGAADWAARALENHDLRRLDPLAGLSDSQVQEMRELLGEP